MSTGTALLIVDFQNDFLPGGALGVPDGDKAQPVISAIAREFEIDLIVMSRDWHPADHVSFADPPKYKDFSWPPHCVQDTHGAEFDETLFGNMKALSKPLIVVTKGDDQSKEAYSAFDGHTSIEEEQLDLHWHDDEWPPPLVTREASLAGVLDQRYSVTKVIVTGLALDYCVRATALDAQRNGFETSVVLEATRPVAYETGAYAVRDLVQHGVEVV